MTEESLYTPAFIAEKCQLPRRTILDLAKRGLIPSITVGRKTRRFHLPSVIEALRGFAKPAPTRLVPVRPPRA